MGRFFYMELCLPPYVPYQLNCFISVRFIAEYLIISWIKYELQVENIHKKQL